MLMLVVFAPDALAFGKNKVTGQRFDWLIHNTEHFDIYYYPDETPLVPIMADMAEQSYQTLSDVLAHEIKDRVPLVLYKSHPDFQQTNIIMDELHEGVGGFSELFKRRVVIPFTGSKTAFQEVIQHELVHIFQYDMIYQKPTAHIYTGEFLYSPPIWFMEGLADHLAEDTDAVGDMVLRNAVLSGFVPPLSLLQDFSVLGSQAFLGYKLGQSAVEFLVQEHGRDKLPLIMDELRHNRTKNMDKVLKNTIGMGLDEFSKKWQRALKRRYWPLLERKSAADEFARQLTGKDDDHGSRPVWSPGGELVACITHSDASPRITLISAKDGRVFDHLLKGRIGGRYESIQTQGNGLAWSPDGDHLAFFTRHRQELSLVVMHVVNREIKHHIPLKMDVAHSPTWAPGSQRIAFVGMKRGQTDLFQITVATGEVSQITRDPFDDRHPTWHPSEEKILYTSEREGKYQLILLDLEQHTQQALSHTGHNVADPSWSPDAQEILFTADLNGIYDIYRMAQDGSQIRRLTNTITGCFRPKLAPDGESLVFESYSDGYQDIYLFDADKALDEPIQTEPVDSSVSPILAFAPMETRRVARKKYENRMMLDAIFGDFQLSSDGVLRNNTQVIASDMMGNHRLGLTLANQTAFLAPDFVASYLYLPYRNDLGVSLFNFHDYHLIDGPYGREAILQRNTGLIGYLSYPLDRYRRFDFDITAYTTPFSYKFLSSRSHERGFLLSASLSYVKDSVLWSEFGPFKGTRYRLSSQRYFPELGSDLSMVNVLADARHYIKLGKRSSLATRGMFGGSYGRDDTLFYLGGIDTLRGYEYEELVGTHAALLSFELRIPFIDELRFGWPIPLAFRGIRGIAFADFGTVWDERSPTFWDRIDGEWQLVDLRGAVGIGLRLRLGFFSLNFDVARRTNLARLDPDVMFHFGLGQEF